MKEACIPGELCCFESIDSTNEEAKRRGESGAPDGSVYVATSRLAERDEEEELGYLRQEKMFSLPYCCDLNCR